jgi:hypothetical protein
VIHQERANCAWIDTLPVRNLLLHEISSDSGK